MLRTKSSLTVLTAAVLCLMPAIMSCNGNGGTGDMDGGTYNPGGGGGGILEIIPPPPARQAQAAAASRHRTY